HRFFLGGWAVGADLRVRPLESPVAARLHAATLPCGFTRVVGLDACASGAYPIPRHAGTAMAGPTGAHWATRITGAHDDQHQQGPAHGHGISAIRWESRQLELERPGAAAGTGTA